ncbi:MAG TPA: hypothetical protein VI956_07265 [Nitrospirota bacterium]|nr:hypothetical protein [Nitrospirota bacterium]
MKRMLLMVLLGLLFVAFGATAARAGLSNEEKKLQSEASALNKEASQPQGEKVVVQKLKQEFNVTDAQITSLRDQKMGYGEMAIVFSLSKQLGGTNGITQQNIDAIMAKRLGPPVMGWGQIAKSYNLKLGAAVSQIKKVKTAAGKEIKHQERTEHKTMREDRRERPGKPDKMERSGAGQHGGGHAR